MAVCALPVLAGCSDSSFQPFRPGAEGQTPPSPPLGAPSFEPLTRNGQIYVAEASLNDRYTKFTGASLVSRFVLYDDSTFALQFASGLYGHFEYDGKFTRVDSRITFIWEGWSTAGPWGAEGTLEGNTLGVVYNSVMQMSDFLDGTYRWSPPTP